MSIKQNNIDYVHETSPLLKVLYDPKVQETFAWLDKVTKDIERKGADKKAIIEDASIFCKLCNKQIHTTDIATMNTMFVKDLVVPYCKECYDTIKKNKYFIVVCAKCKTIKLVGEPIKNAYTKFVYKANTVYHFAFCPHCNAEYYKAKGFDANVDGTHIPAITIEELKYNKDNGFEFLND